ncbi:MAG: copper chaperone PCu(A)C, partial [Betaproteobacteria bacterium]
MKRLAIVMAAPLLVATTLAASAAHAVFSINEPWVRAGPGRHTAEVFMNLRSSDAAIVVAIDSFAARAVTIRASAPKGGGARAETIALPANTVVALTPASIRIRLDGLVRRLKSGEFVPLTLFVRGADGKEQKYFVNAEVRQHSPTDDERDAQAGG